MVVVVNLSSVDTVFVVENVDEIGVVVDIKVDVDAGVSVVEVEEATAVEKVLELAADDPPVLKGTFCLCIRSNSAADANESTASSAVKRRAPDRDWNILNQFVEEEERETAGQADIGLLLSLENTVNFVEQITREREW